MGKIREAAPHFALAAASMIGIGVAGREAAEFVHGWDRYEYDKKLALESCALSTDAVEAKIAANCGNLLISEFGVLQPAAYMVAGEAGGKTYIKDEDVYMIEMSVQELQSETAATAEDAREERDDFRSYGTILGVGAGVGLFYICEHRPRLTRTRRAFRLVGVWTGLMDEPQPVELPIPYDQDKNGVEQPAGV